MNYLSHCCPDCSECYSDRYPSTSAIYRLSSLLLSICFVIALTRVVLSAHSALPSLSYTCDLVLSCASTCYFLNHNFRPQFVPHRPAKSIDLSVNDVFSFFLVLLSMRRHPFCDDAILVFPASYSTFIYWLTYSSPPSSCLPASGMSVCPIPFLTFPACVINVYSDRCPVWSSNIDRSPPVTH